MAAASRGTVERQAPRSVDLGAFDAGLPLRWPTLPADELPDDLVLPCSDGEIVENLGELSQAALLTTSIKAALDRVHPDGQYLTGGNSGIYWDYLEPPLRGAIAPDWFYVPNVDPNRINNHRRRSYVMWKEDEIPFLVIEIVSGDGRKERDRTPNVGKFWLCEQRVRASYYVIYEPFRDGVFEVYSRVDEVYRPVAPNERGHVPIPEMGVELGCLWGSHDNATGPFLRWYDLDGHLLLSGWESAEVETRRADEATRRADDATQSQRIESRRADALAAKLRSLGIDPDSIAGSA